MGFLRNNLAKWFINKRFGRLLKQMVQGEVATAAGSSLTHLVANFLGDFAHNGKEHQRCPELN
ncbi:hypothetical protein RGR602_PC01455 (plasmid) [Rhizobium gallicum bv. gallicum R602sp]|uniref:Uncharacterized protein n=1 Tax=Rhizobium gallicum bv. gallicum R602sp TaxID=1041138 RepID=A0A0B4XEH5_9HYPH|nr:hypothetical protein RGR602_PC01455 [Rhizobium gallicum bv. gallicum R602sp]